MQKKHSSHQNPRRIDGWRIAHGGFTLVEMLVTVAIMLLLMTMFAEVFQLAGNTISSQRGIAENDQRSRSIQTVITADLDKRSYRYVMPWGLAEDPGLPETNGVLRKGYLYISENDLTNDLDDFLQFTVDVNDIRQNKDISKIYGRATAVAPVTAHPNQPEADDGWAEPNSTSETSAAEVCYFVRNGKLYRRFLLLRQPLLLDGSTAQPTFNDPNGTVRDMFDPNASIPPGGLSSYSNQGTTNATTFWNEFDNSAFRYGATGFTPWAHFHGVEDLANDSSTFFPLGKPKYRFGHFVDTGRSREFDSNDGYFGRFTHEETSHPDFRYPQGLSNIGNGANPMTDTSSSFAMNTNDAVFDAFRNGPRRGEDLLLSNVHSFDIKVWDIGLGGFVDIGSSNAVDFQSPANPYYGPKVYNSTDDPRKNNVFDSWYPFDLVTPLEMDLNNDSQNDPPPYRHLRNLPTTFGGSVALWQANRPVNVGDLVFPNVNQRNNGLRFCYRCVGKINNATGTGATEPLIWPSVIGGRVSDVTDATTTPVTQIVWEAIENWKPLKAIQITIRFLDTTSQQMRQLTIVHSFVD